MLDFGIMRMLTYHQGEEVSHLPMIVESAESSPQAARACASLIRKYLTKGYANQPHVQYNAVMLISILANNPGRTFTVHLQGRFVSTVRDLLRMSQDPSVQQIMRETLQSLEDEKAYDTNLNALFAMWRKEKGGQPMPIPSAWYEQGIQHGHQHQRLISQQQQIQQYYEQHQKHNHDQPHSRQVMGADGHYYSRSRTSKRSKVLPPLQELVARVEEARTTAKLLMQTVQSTPPTEILGNDLVREFSERAQSAQRSIQGYINCDNPAPDDRTLQTLVETNEQLSLAMSRHQRAILTARRLVGQSTGAISHGVGNENALPVLQPHREEPSRQDTQQQQQQRQNSVSNSGVLTHERNFYTPTETIAAPLLPTATTTPTNVHHDSSNATVSSVHTSPSFASMPNPTFSSNNDNRYNIGGASHGRLNSPFSNNDSAPYSNFYSKITPSTQAQPSNMGYLPHSHRSNDATAGDIGASASVEADDTYAPPAPIAPLRVRKVSKESNGDGNHIDSRGSSSSSSKNGRNYSSKPHSSSSPDVIAGASSSTVAATNTISTSSTLISNNNIVSPTSIDRSTLISPVRPPSPPEVYVRPEGNPFSDENAVPVGGMPVSTRTPAPAPAVTGPAPTYAPMLGEDGLRRIALRDGSSGSVGDGAESRHVYGNAFANRNGKGQ